MRLLAATVAAAFALTPAAAVPALPNGARAPDFTTSGALAGRPFRLNLRARAPARPGRPLFLSAGLHRRLHGWRRTPFRKPPRTSAAPAPRVVGMSADNYDTLRRFSVEGCRSAFPVATASRATIRAYDVALGDGTPRTNRTSYVIAPNGRIIYVHSELDWRHHVTNTLAAVRQWRARQRRR